VGVKNIFWEVRGSPQLILKNHVYKQSCGACVKCAEVIEVGTKKVLKIGKRF
jgi:hypothetical protein